MKSYVIFGVFALAFSGCESQGERPTTLMSSDSKELIVLAAPTSDDSYYADVDEDIFNFHIQYAQQIQDRDDVLILTDRKGFERYAQALGRHRVAIAPMADIWARDFSLSNVEQPVMFRYTAAGQGGGVRGQSAADSVQDELADLAETAGLEFRESELLNDGGNFVDDYAGNVVVSRKFLRDNGLTEKQGRNAIRDLTGARHVAFIESDEQGGLEHADGVVSFVDTNVLITNSYDEDPEYARKLREDLNAGLPGVQIHEIVTPYDDTEIYDERFGSACGLYTNALVTPDRIYLPQFGIAEDRIAVEQVGRVTSREVVPVPSELVCRMGGGVRCMSWQLRGDNAAALLKHLKRSQ